jgi:hypothetical protein
MKQKTVGILSLMTVMLFAMTTATLAVGEFKIQYPVGTTKFGVDSSGNVNASGQIYEKNVLLGDTYWNLTDVATPSNGDTTHISTADQIYDWVIAQGYTATGWDTLDDMVLTSGYIYIGNSSNEPQERAITGDITLSNTGVVAVVDSSHLHDAANITTGTIDNARITLVEDEIPTLSSTWDYTMDADRLTGLDALNNKITISGENVTAGTVAAARIDAAMATDAEVAAFGFYNNIANVTGTVVDTKYCTYNASNTKINCQSVGAGLSNIVEDTTPQLGGMLDVNGFGIEEPGSTNVTITSTGNLIIVLS